ncbi:hypothetical protein CHUV0807_1144 [Cardiobacterium hominis]|uniref:Uncharacterized protein n=1 Tax=Cardiobacterium hominis TaxID=2718 RepID=A0A1C3H460_9GAMM|nr:hypothetical protein CHUV0807_1144 [Cardiobacterium hominis]
MSYLIDLEKHSGVSVDINFSKSNTEKGTEKAAAESAI